MRINFPWIIDPKTKAGSVSLTNLMISILFLLVAGSLNLAGLTANTSLAVEYFTASAALYFGRNLNLSKPSTDNPSDKEVT